MTVNSINNKSNDAHNNNNATLLRSAAPPHIELKSVSNIAGGVAAAASAGLGQLNNGTIHANHQESTTIITSTYPPSPPPTDASQLAGEAPAKPLTMANVSTLSTATAAVTAVGGSPFSAISTSPTTDEDDGESSEEEGDSASEISFSSNSSVLSSIAGGNNIATVNVASPTNKDHQFLASVFGASYADSFNKLGVEVILPAEDVFPAELGLKGAAVLHAPQQGTKTCYLCPKEMEKLDSSTLVELLEIADEDLECSALVIALERGAAAEDNDDDETLAETLHALMYVGGAIVAPDAGVVKYDSEKYILVGLDL